MTKTLFRFMTAGTAVLVAAVLLCHCGSTAESSDPGSGRGLRLIVGDSPIAMQTGERLVVQVLVVGDGADKATISSPNLPAFATLQRSALTLTPSRAFEGNYDITLVATVGQASSSAVVHLTVKRDNTAPAVEGRSLMDTDGGNYDVLTNPTCNPACLVHGTPSVDLVVVDADRDQVTVEVEVVPGGQSFSGKPTYAVTAPVGIDSAKHCFAAYDAFHACIEVDLTGLVPGGSYRFATRVRDALGAIATNNTVGPISADGWVAGPYNAFRTEP